MPKLRDYCTEKRTQKKTSEITSNVALALCYGNFFPCLILRPAKCIKDGHHVYFFHTKEETEVASQSIIGNLEALEQFPISYFNNDGNICTGTVAATDKTEEKPCPLNFLVMTDRQCLWVSFPSIFLTMEQSKPFI